MIQTIHSFREVPFSNLSTKSLVIFDVDETLITPEDILLKPAGRNFQGWGKIPPEQFENYITIMLASTKYVLVDEALPEIIQELSKNGIPAIGLTNCSTGAVGVIQSMEKWRLDQLKAVGIDFSSFFKEEYVFSELGTARPPIFKNGVLFSGDFQSPHNSTKGKLLAAFFSQIQWKPQQVVFVDDDRKHLEAVGEEMRRNEIFFQGYQIQKPSPQLDERVAESQIRILLASKKWVSDKDVKIMGL